MNCIIVLGQYSTKTPEVVLINFNGHKTNSHTNPEWLGDSVENFPCEQNLKHAIKIKSHFLLTLFYNFNNFKYAISLILTLMYILGVNKTAIYGFLWLTFR